MTMTTDLCGKITKTFCVKPDGWFSGVFYDENKSRKVKINGVYSRGLDMSLTYEIFAELVHHPVYGDQYKILSMRPKVIMDKDHIISYLSGESFKGIGVATAEKIYNAFGLDSLEIIRNEPSKLRTILGLNDKTVRSLIMGESSGSIDNQLRKLVPTIKPSLVQKIIDRYCGGDQEIGVTAALRTITDDTYSMLYELPNVSFKDIDEIALAVAYSLYDPRRMNECFRFALYNYQCNTQNVYVNTVDTSVMNDFYNQVLYNVGYSDMVQNQYGQLVYKNECITAVNNMFQDLSAINGVVVSYGNNNEMLIYDEATAKQEDGLALYLAKQLHKKSLFMSCATISDIERDIALYETRNHMQFDDTQHTAILMSLMSPISIISGGPGHGKTSTIDCVLDIWSKYTNKAPVISAPTGRAVSILKKSITNTYGVDCHIATAMRIICTTKIAKNKNDGKYEDLKKKYSGTLVVLDECSMLGIKTAYEFLRLFDNCQFVFIGDVNQLPSIEYGQFFKDMCDCGLIVKTELTVNHRANGRLIVDNAETINVGCTNVDFSDRSQFELIDCQGDYQQMIIDSFMNYVMKNGAVDPLALSNVAILCPTNKGTTGAALLNYTIREMINPKRSTAKETENGYAIERTHIYVNPQIPDTKIRVGDRVMYTKNRTDVPCKTLIGRHGDDEMGIFNGDTGFVYEFHKGTKDTEDVLTIQLDNGKLAYIEGEYMKDIVLVYAMTIHKAQGSEYPFVIISMQHSLLNIPGDFASRNLLYTAVTRAKEKVQIIGNPESFYKCIVTLAHERNSQLMSKVKYNFMNKTN